LSAQETANEPTLQVMVTSRAQEKASALLRERDLEQGLLRVFVVGAGCSGVQYGMALSGEADDDDTVLNLGTVKLVVDSQSLPFVEGAQIDFLEEDLRSGFTITNPSAPSGGGCGGGCSCGRQSS
jgi:iron-sulfur cluster insertion protein